MLAVTADAFEDTRDRPTQEVTLLCDSLVCTIHRYGVRIGGVKEQ
jgi:hypothetical protein